MKLLRIFHYLLVFSTTVPLLLAAVFITAACGATIGRKFGSDMRILIRLLEIDDLLSIEKHKEFWREVLS